MSVVIITFAGRRDRMSFLVDSLALYLAGTANAEWHIWNYARTAEDEAWVSSLDNGSTMRVMVPEHRRGYSSCYAHYTSKRYDADTVFIKVDDDIVFIDMEQLDGFIQFRRAHPEFYILSANVVNNPLCFELQKSYGCWEGLTLNDPPGLIHHRFLDTPAVQTGDVFVFTNPIHRLNINFVAWLGADLDTIRRAEEVNADEVNLSVCFPRLLQRPVAVYGPLVVSHLSFAAQESGMDIQGILERYRATRKVSF
jgi:hypothetical protein